MWSIGVIVLMLLTGKNPFLQEQDQRKLKEDIKNFNDDESKIFKQEEFLNLDQVSQRFIKKLITKDVDNRFSAQ